MPFSKPGNTATVLFYPVTKIKNRKRKKNRTINNKILHFHSPDSGQKIYQSSFFFFTPKF